MPDVYEGDRPFIFVSYAHADDDAVLPLIAALVAEGYRVWWDRGIELATPFPDYIADHVHDCECFVPLMSRALLASAWCCKEIEFAIRFRKKILPVFLEDVELSLGLDLQIGSLQALYRSTFATDAAFHDELFRAKVLDPCLKPEGARRRGAKARGGGDRTGLTFQVSETYPTMEPSFDSQPADHWSVNSSIVASRPSSGRVNGVEPRDGLAAYSWAELKVLSHMIAAVGNVADGLSIARIYRLVNVRSEILGDAKTIMLADGTEAHVRILGFLHDELAGGGRAGISFGFSDVPMTHEMNNGVETNVGGWEGSGMRGWLNSSFLSLLPGDLRNNVVEVKKWTNNTGQLRYGCDVSSAVTGTHDKLWLLSMAEIFGRLTRQRDAPRSYTDFYDAEGSQYKLYEDNRVSTTSFDFCRKVGTHTKWWLRSPHSSCGVDFHYINENGSWSDSWDFAKDALGVSPGFCI